MNSEVTRTPMRDSNGFLRALPVRNQDHWIEVLAASDGEPLVAWSDQQGWPEGTALIRNEQGKVMGIIQVVELGDRVLTYFLPSDP